MTDAPETDRRVVRPAPGLRVIDPATGTALPEKGKPVDWSSFWERRLADGDIAVAEDDAPPARAVREKGDSK